MCIESFEIIELFLLLHYNCSLYKKHTSEQVGKWATGSGSSSIHTPQSKMAAHVFQWSSSPNANAEKKFYMNGSYNMHGSITSFHAPWTQIIYLANQNDPGQHHWQTRQVHNTVTSFSGDFLAFINNRKDHKWKIYTRKTWIMCFIFLLMLL